jgi:hypothetical protein
MDTEVVFSHIHTSISPCSSLYCGAATDNVPGHIRLPKLPGPSFGGAAVAACCLTSTATAFFKAVVWIVAVLPSNGDAR